jgi:glc operon protein GlcG
MDKITLDTAHKLAAIGVSTAGAEYKRPVCIAVVDGHGDLLAFSRMDGALARSVAISQGKAYSAARMGVNTDAFLERLHREKIQASDFCDPRITSMPGGAVLKSGAGVVIGGVGMSGLKPEEDQAIVVKLASLVESGSV